MKKKHNCSKVVIANCHIGVTVPAAVMLLSVEQ